MSNDVQPSVEDDLSWLHNGPNPATIEEMRRAEIEEARTATPTPRQWQPIEIDEALMR